VFERVRDSIQQDIATRALKDQLPSEREIAERLGFSRSAVRETTINVRAATSASPDAWFADEAIRS